jgi:hypothetical protein
MYKIDEKLLNTIIAYLGEKPYKETFQLIGALSNLKKENATTETKTKRGKK